MHDAEALLFVHDDQAQVGEGDVLLQQPVRTDDDVDFTFGQVAHDSLLIGLGDKARELFDSNRERAEARAEVAVVLIGQQASSGTKTATCFLSAMALNAARIATSVLP